MVSPAVWATLVSSALAVPGVVHFNLGRENRHPSGETLVDRLSRRDASPDTLDLENEQLLYTATLQIGSNKQKVVAQVDTGSSDLWVMDASNPLCSQILDIPDTSANDSSSTGISAPNTTSIVCFTEYMFASKNSTTFKSNNSAPFSIEYGDYTFANGTFCTDDIVVGDDTIQGANFALATKANSSQAVFGIGLETTESSVDPKSLLDTDGGAKGPVNGSYANLPVQLKEQGFIDRVAYSLYLDDISAASGSLLIGGVDHSKYSGQLGTVPLVSAYEHLDHPIDFSVIVNSISGYTADNKTATFVTMAQPALLDSGTSYIIMPNQALAPIMESIGARYSDEMGYYFAPCNGGWVGGGLDFEFSGVHITVPFSELIQGMDVSYGSNSEKLCLVTMLPSDEEFILGDTFLRGAYVVYDLENKEVSLAEAKWDTSASADIESIPASGTIPSATKAPSYSSSSYSPNIDTTFATIYGLKSVDPQFNETSTYLPFSSLGPVSELTFSQYNYAEVSATSANGTNASAATATGSGSGSGSNAAVAASGSASASDSSTVSAQKNEALPSAAVTGLFLFFASVFTLVL